jgi:hypothetical protein
MAPVPDENGTEATQKFEPENEGTAPGSGHLEGRVLYRCNGRPATGYYVYLFPGSTGSAIAISTCQVDKNGVYRFTNQKTGSYRLTANINADVKGLSYIHAESEVIADTTTTVPDILLPFCPDIKLTSPVDGAIVATSRPAFSWKQYAGAVAYRVNVQSESGTVYRFPEYPPGTDKTMATIPEDLPPGNYEWYIWVYDDPSALVLDMLGESSRWSFTITTSK